MPRRGRFLAIVPLILALACAAPPGREPERQAGWRSAGKR